MAQAVVAQFIVGNVKVPYVDYRCKVSSESGQCRAMLRFLKLRPSDVDVLAQQGIPEFAVWKYIIRHLTDHEGLFFRS